MTHPLNATMHRVPDVGSFRCAKSRDGSHISVSVFGKYPPMLPAMPLVIPRDLRRREDLIGSSENIDAIVRTRYIRNTATLLAVNIGVIAALEPALIAAVLAIYRAWAARCPLNATVVTTFWASEPENMNGISGRADSEESGNCVE